MAIVFERLRTIALSLESSPEHNQAPFTRSSSLCMPEKSYIQTQQKQSKQPEEKKRSPQKSQNRGFRSRQLLARFPKSNRDDLLHRPNIIRSVSYTGVDKSCIRTVDDFVVNSRSTALPAIVAEDSDQNPYSFSGDSSSEELTPPASVRLGIGTAPCFLVSLSTDEELDEPDGGEHWHQKRHYLPYSNRSIMAVSKEIDADDSLCTPKSNKNSRNSLLVMPSSIRHVSNHDIEASKAKGMVNNSIAYSSQEAHQHEGTTLPLMGTNVFRPKSLDVGGKEEFNNKMKVGANIKYRIDNVKNFPANVTQEVTAAQSYTGKNSSTSLCLHSVRTLRVSDYSEELTTQSVQSFNSEEGTGYSSDTESKMYMLSLFNNPGWVQAEDLCQIGTLGSLGRGSSGGVTAVFHIPTCKIYALKATSHDSEIDNLVILSKALGDKRTPQLMDLYGLFEDANSNENAIVLEYMDLGSLQDHFISKGKRCTEEQVRHIARETLLGLQQLHSFETPLIHRDIKPHNILIESGGSVRVSDYGLLCSLEDKNQHCEDNENPQCKDMAGTSKYFSPERHNGKFSMPSDIWALGVTLLECFLGTSLDPKDLEDVKVAGGQVHPLDLHDQNEVELSDEALHFLQCCLEYSPMKRWDANMLLKHKYLKPQNIDLRSIFVPKRKIAGNVKLLEEILEIIQTFIRRNHQEGMSQKDIWDNVKGITHEMRLSNIVRWTGCSKSQIEHCVMHLYNKRTNLPSRFK